MRTLLKPPADVEPRTLFELLSERRPTWPIEARFTDAQEVKLYARALTPCEWAHARRDLKAALLYGLCTDAGQVFETVSDVGELRSQEAKRLLDAVIAGHAVCAPTYGRIDIAAWEVQLQRGAEQSGSIAKQWDDCVDVLVGQGRVAYIDRPERFWGVPVAEVLDGHKMVQAVCRKLLDARRPK